VPKGGGDSELAKAAEALIVKGKEQGVLSPDDIAAGFPGIELEPDDLIRISTAFRDMGIKVADGEEAVENFTDTDGIYGSRHFARELAQSGSAKSFRGGILFDMIGDRLLKVTLPPNSPPKITADIFSSADALKVRKGILAHSPQP